MKSIRAKIIICQFLSVIVGRHIVDVTLIAILNVIEEKMIIGHVKYQFFNSGGQNLHMNGIFGIAAGVRASQQRMKYDDGLVQVPNEYALRYFNIFGGQTGIANDAARWTGMSVPSSTGPSRLRGRR